MHCHGRPIVGRNDTDRGAAGPSIVAGEIHTLAVAHGGGAAAVHQRVVERTRAGNRVVVFAVQKGDRLDQRFHRRYRQARIGAGGEINFKIVAVDAVLRTGGVDVGDQHAAIRHCTGGAVVTDHAGTAAAVLDRQLIKTLAAESVADGQ